MEILTMAILKNEPLFSFEERNYSKPRHIVVEGSYEEIGYDLAKLAQKEYGCSLGAYADPIYGAARRDYFANNWPSMNERSKGARRAFGLAENDNSYDASGLPFDLYDVQRKAPIEKATMCSALVLPKEKTEDGKGVLRLKFQVQHPEPAGHRMLRWTDDASTSAARNVA
jgi:hypothetical protein